MNFSFRKKKSKNTSEIITGMHETFQRYYFPDLDKRIIEIGKSLPKEAEKDGEKAARNNIPLVEDTEITPLELSLLQKSQNLVEEVKSVVGGSLKSVYHLTHQKKSEIDRLGIIADQRVQESIEAAKEFKSGALKNLKELMTGKTKRANEQIQKKYADLSNFQFDLNLVKKDAKTGFAMWQYIAILGVILLADIPMNYNLMLGQGENIIITALATLGLCFTVVFTSHYYGLFLKQDTSKNKTKSFLISFGINLLILAVFVFIGTLRALSSGGNMSLVFFSLINYLIFWCGVSASYFYHPKSKEALQECKRLKKEQREAEKKLAEAEQQAKSVQTEFDSEQERILNDFDERVKKAESSEHPLVKEYNELQRYFFASWSYAQAKEKQVETIKNNALQSFRKANYMNRSDKSKPLYWKNPLPELTLYFQSFSEFFTRENEAQDPGNSIIKPLVKGLSILVVTAFLAIGCESPEVSSKIVIGIDITDSIEQPLHQISQHILEQFERGNQEINRYEAEIFLLSDLSLSHTYTATWEYGNSIENPKLRMDRKAEFVGEIDSLLKEAFTHSQGKEFSRLYYSICSSLHGLVQSSAKQKKLILFTDLLENDPHVFSIYKKGSIELIQAEPKKIMTAFENECALPNLSGIEIIVVHHPDISTDRMVWLMQGFYKKLFESKGATISYVANL